MKRVTKSVYNSALKDIIKILRAKPELLDDCRFVALLGSVREGEHILAYSDLDILFILKSNSSGSLNPKILLALQKICGVLSKKYPIKISFLTHTEKEFKEYVDYEYLVHYSWGKVLFGDGKLYSGFFQRHLHLKKPVKRELLRQMYNAILHARFNLIRRYVSLNIFNTKRYKRELLKLFIDNLIEIADWRLIAEGIWSTSKRQIMKEIEKTSKSSSRYILYKAYKYRKNWNNKLAIRSVDDEFFVRSIDFINDCVVELEDRL